MLPCSAGVGDSAPWATAVCRWALSHTADSCSDTKTVHKGKETRSESPGCRGNGLWDSNATMVACQILTTTFSWVKLDCVKQQGFGHCSNCFGKEQWLWMRAATSSSQAAVLPGSQQGKQVTTLSPSFLSPFSLSSFTQYHKQEAVSPWSYSITCSHQVLHTAPVYILYMTGGHFLK